MIKHKFLKSYAIVIASLFQVSLVMADGTVCIKNDTNYQYGPSLTITPMGNQGTWFTGSYFRDYAGDDICQSLSSKNLKPGDEVCTTQSYSWDHYCAYDIYTPHSIYANKVYIAPSRGSSGDGAFRVQPSDLHDKPRSFNINMDGNIVAVSD